MKRKHYISALIILAGVLLSAWLYHTPHPLPYSQCSDLFLQYKDTPGIKAAFIKDFPLNDTLTVDVTMLQAKDSATWVKQIMTICQIENEEDYIPRELMSMLVSKTPPFQPMKEEITDNNLLIGYMHDLTIGLFHLETTQQYEAIFDHYFNLLIKIQNGKNI